MKVFVFDLDFTLWDAGDTWCDATNPPYKWKDSKLFDRSERWIRLYEDVIPILTELKQKEKKIAAASRTFEPGWAQDLLHLFDIDKYFDRKEIYPSVKTSHLTRIRDHFKVEFSEMVFFDDEYRNIADVEKLGVKTVHVTSGIHLSEVLHCL